MTPDRTWDPLRFQRGTRGFAAFVTAINGFALLGIAGVVAPASDLPDPAMAWVVIAGLAAGIAHLVALIGLIRGRAWARSLVGYLAAAGIGAALFALLMTWRAQEAVLGAGGSTANGFFVWMIGSWLVATRFTFKAYRVPATRRALAAGGSLPTPSLPTPRTAAPETEPSPMPRRPLRVAAA